jgi:hypothetical protein
VARGSSSHRLLAVAFVASLAACAGEPSEASLNLTPWEEPVDGTVAVTSWQADGQPVGPFGPDGTGWRSPDELIEAMATSLAGDDVRTVGRVVTENESGTVIGWVRIIGGHDAALAVDMQVHMRNDRGSWFVADMRTREHCSHEAPTGECR